ncbi:MAG: L-seryl-tRNA(Sec) selenium transferase [bacterium]
MKNKQELLRNLPSVDQLLKSDPVRELLRKYPRLFVTKAIRNTIKKYRERIKAGILIDADISSILKDIQAESRQESGLHLRPVINATGIVIHTNLGRAPLSRKVLDNVVRIAEGYSNLEYDIEKGVRGKRYSHVKSIINEITGARDCLVVNNNAGAVLLCLAAIAKGNEVIVSRGELVEIGGAFRVPDVMLQSGAILREVGTTNKTHLYDYERAITSSTAMILKVHRSNFRITGFTEDVSLEELAALGKKYTIPVMFDLGSGSLVDLKPLGVHDEPSVQEVVQAGADLTTFSGDKLLGGPQAGIIVGRPDLIQMIQQHPLTRALRIDKFTLAALESTFMIYADREKAGDEIPALRMLFSSEEALKIRARRLASALKKAGIPADIRIAKDRTKAGGGSLPEVEFVTWTVSLSPEGMSVNALEERLRKCSLPIIGRINEGRFILDMMTVKSSQISKIVGSFAEVFAP